MNFVFPIGTISAAAQAVDISGAGQARGQAAAQRGAGAKTDGVPADRNRDTVQISARDMQSARENGFIEVGGRRFMLSEEMAEKLENAYEAASARNQAVALRNEMVSARANAERMADAAEEEAKSMRQAIEIARRISKGGRVPPKDEKFLMEYSQTMYMNAKMLALMATEHKKHKSVLKDEEREEIVEDIDPTVQHVEASVSGGEITGVSTVTAVPVAVSEG